MRPEVTGELSFAAACAAATVPPKVADINGQWSKCPTDKYTCSAGGFSVNAAMGVDAERRVQSLPHPATSGVADGIGHEFVLVGPSTLLPQ